MYGLVILSLLSVGCSTVSVTDGESEGRENAHATASTNALPSANALSFIEAVKLGQLERVRELLAKGSPLGGEGAEPYGALFYASVKGYSEIVALLLEVGEAVNVSGRGGWTPLMAAAFQGHTQIVQQLIKAGAELEARSADGMTALAYAVRYQREDVIAALLAHGAVVNTTVDTLQSKTLLALAVEQGQQDIVIALLQAGADLHWRPASALPIGFYAAARNDRALLELLINRGARLTDRDSQGNTVLHYVANRAKPAVVQYLLDNGADVAAVNSAGKTALIQVAEFGNTENMLLLFSKATRAERRQVFLAVAQSGVIRSLEVLIARGIDVNVRNGKGQTALMLASANRHEAIVKRLLERKADASVVDEQGRTALDYALSNPPLRTSLVELLQSAGAS